MDTMPPASTARANLERMRTAAHGRGAHKVHRGHGDLLPVPSLAHPLDTVDDSALLLTVAVVLDERQEDRE